MTEKIEHAIQQAEIHRKMTKALFLQIRELHDESLGNEFINADVYTAHCMLLNDLNSEVDRILTNYINNLKNRNV